MNKFLENIRAILIKEYPEDGYSYGKEYFYSHTIDQKYMIQLYIHKLEFSNYEDIIDPTRNVVIHDVDGVIYYVNSNDIVTPAEFRSMILNSIINE